MKSRGILHSFSLKCHHGLGDAFGGKSVRYTIVLGEKGVSQQVLEEIKYCPGIYLGTSVTDI